MSSGSWIQASRITKSYPMGNSRLEILKGIDLQVSEGEAVCINGSSGAGKSTLLHIMGTLDRPTSGSILFQGHELNRLSDGELAEFRNKELGFVFQFHHLLAEFSALENVMLPLRIGQVSTSQARSQATDLLKELGLGNRINHYPSELSGGEQQRVAIARALVRKPRILLADEPTGNLDTENAEKIQTLFFELQRARGLTLIVVTHDSAFAAKFRRRLQMKDGGLS